MKTIKIIWGVIAVLWLGWIGINLSLYIGSADSAMQASQLYDEASMNILRIIAITLLLSLANEPADKLIEQLQQQTKGLAEQTKRIDDLLGRLQPNTMYSTAVDTTVPENVEQTEPSSPVIPPSIEQTVTETPEAHLCPKCGSQMEIRTATTGEQKGKQFYVCSTYPTCRGYLPA
jgi:hypothetical protein